MSEQKWTPEPWVATTAGPVMRGYSQGDAIASVEHSTLIAGCFSDVKGGPEVATANAQRAVACVNALAGINPEAVPALIEALQELYAGCVSLDPEQAILPFQMQQAFRALTKCGAGLSKARVTVIQQASNTTEKDGQ